MQRNVIEQAGQPGASRPGRAAGRAARWLVGAAGALFAGSAAVGAKPRGGGGRRGHDDDTERRNGDQRSERDRDDDTGHAERNRSAQRADRESGHEGREERDDRSERTAQTADDPDADANAGGGGNDSGSLVDRLRDAATRKRDQAGQNSGDGDTTDGGENAGDGITAAVDPASGSVSVVTDNISFSESADGGIKVSTSNINFSSAPKDDSADPSVVADPGDGDAGRDGGNDNVNFES